MYEELKTMTEKQLREWAVPYVKTREELDAILNNLSTRKQDYGTCVYSVSIATVATYNYMNTVVGSSGFQAGCADIDFIARVRGLKNGFQIIDFSNVIYPLYFNNTEKFPNATDILLNNLEVIAIEVQKRLKDYKENGSKGIHPDVLNHWHMIMELAYKNPDIIKRLAVEEL